MTITREPIHPWGKIAEWAGWRKGQKATKSDCEVAEMWGVTRRWVSKQRAKRGVLRLIKTKRSWEDADYALVVETCQAIGRTPMAFIHEHRRRMGWTKRGRP